MKLAQGRRVCLWVGLLLGLASIADAGKSLELPSYIIPCSRHETDPSGCAVKRGNDAIPTFIKGDKKYKVPVLDPLVITSLHVDAGVLGLNFTATNVKIAGLRNAVLKAAPLDFKTLNGHYDLFVPRIEVSCEYDISGRILILPITGNGHGNLTLMNMTIIYTYDIEHIKDKESDFYIPNNYKLYLDTTRLYVHLDNLFNGNKFLGDEMNRFMDENWEELVKEFRPVIGEAIGEVMVTMQKNVFKLVDYQHSYPDIPPDQWRN